MKNALLTPLGLNARHPLGFREDGRPIYPVAGGDGRTALPLTGASCVARMEAITDEVERLSRFEKLTVPQDKRLNELSDEFKALSRQRVALAFADDMSGLRFEDGSPRARQVAPEMGFGLRDPARRALDSLRSV